MTSDIAKILAKFVFYYAHQKNRCSSVCVATKERGLDDLGSNPRRVLKGFFYLRPPPVSRLDLRPTQSSIKWVYGAIFLPVKRRRREAIYLTPSCVEVKGCVEL